MRHLRLKRLRHLPCWNGRLLCLGNWSIIIYQDLGCSMTFWDGWYNLCVVCHPILSLNTGYSQQFLQFFVQLLGCCFIFYAVNRVLHVSRLDDCFYCEWATILMLARGTNWDSTGDESLRILLWCIHIYLVHGPFHNCASDFWRKVGPSPLFRFADTSLLCQIQYRLGFSESGWEHQTTLIAVWVLHLLHWSLRDTPDCLAEQSNTIRTLVVALSTLTIGKWGK